MYQGHQAARAKVTAIPKSCRTWRTVEPAVVYFIDGKMHRPDVNILMGICTHVCPRHDLPDLNTELVRCLCQPRPFSQVTPVTVSATADESVIGLMSSGAFGVYSRSLASPIQCHV